MHEVFVIIAIWLHLEEENFQIMQNKYKNKKCTYNNIEFASIKERNYYIYLKQLEDKRTIKDLKCQVKMPFTLDGKKLFSYIADFTYYDDFGLHIIDVKSPITAKNSTFRLKKKLIEAQYKIEIEII